MDEEVLVQELVNSLTFEVEAITTEDVLKFTSTDGTPLNVKVRVRNKNEPRLIQHGFVSVPRFGNQTNTTPERIRLIGSDQTILSFSVFLESDQNNQSSSKSRKHGFHFFKLGGCLGTSYDEDNGPYLPGTSNKKALRSKSSSKSDSLVLNVNKDSPAKQNLQTSNVVARNQRKLFGKCKPGGCLDPPFGEDKYPYTLPKIQPYIELKQSLNRVEDNRENLSISLSGVKPLKALRSNEPTKTVLKSNKNEIDGKPVLDIFEQSGSIELASNYSNSIITYPPELSSSDTQNNDQDPKKKNRSRSYDDSSPRQSFEYPSYFIPPKDVIRHREEGRRYSRELSNGTITSNSDNNIKNEISQDNNPRRTPPTNNPSEKNKENEQAVTMSPLNLKKTSIINRVASVLLETRQNKSPPTKSDIPDKDATFKKVTRSNKNEEDIDNISESINKEKSRLQETKDLTSSGIFPNEQNENILQQLMPSSDYHETLRYSYLNSNFENILKGTLPKEASSKNINNINLEISQTTTTDLLNPSVQNLLDVYNTNDKKNTKPKKHNNIDLNESTDAKTIIISSSAKSFVLKTSKQLLDHKDSQASQDAKDDKKLAGSQRTTENTRMSSLILPGIIQKQPQHYKNTNDEQKINHDNDPTNNLRTENPLLQTSIEKLEMNKIEHIDLSYDNILNENKEFATSSTESIGSDENFTPVYDNTKKQVDMVEKKSTESSSTNADNVIITNKTLQERKSSAILHKTLFGVTNESELIYDDVNRINPIKRHTLTMIESNTSLQKQVDEISTRPINKHSQSANDDKSISAGTRITSDNIKAMSNKIIESTNEADNVSYKSEKSIMNKIGTTEHQLVNEFALGQKKSSEFTEQSSANKKPTTTGNTDSAKIYLKTNVPLETQPGLFNNFSSRISAISLNENRISYNNTNLVPVEFGSQLQDTEDAFNREPLKKPEYNNLISNSTININDTQTPKVTGSEIINNDLNHKHGSQLSEKTLDKPDVPISLDIPAFSVTKNTLIDSDKVKHDETFVMSSPENQKDNNVDLANPLSSCDDTKDNSNRVIERTNEADNISYKNETSITHKVETRRNQLLDDLAFDAAKNTSEFNDQSSVGEKLTTTGDTDSEGIYSRTSVPTEPRLFQNVSSKLDKPAYDSLILNDTQTASVTGHEIIINNANVGYNPQVSAISVGNINTSNIDDPKYSVSRNILIDSYKKTHESVMSSPDHLKEKDEVSVGKTVVEIDLKSDRSAKISSDKEQINDVFESSPWRAPIPLEESSYKDHSGTAMNLSVIDVQPSTAFNQQTKSNSRDAIISRSIAKDKETLLLNLSFQSYVNDRNEMVVETLNPREELQRYTDDAVTVVKSLIRRGNEISIPVNAQTDLTLNFLNNSDKNNNANNSDNVTLTVNSRNQHADQSQFPASKPEDVLNKSLAIIYESGLIPLHNVIRNLTEEIKELSVQQELFKDKLHSSKRTRSLRLIPVSKRCGCRKM